MSERDRPVFLARETYRQRRLMDAAKVLPALGAAAFMFPLLWASGVGTGGGLIYLFVAWLVLIVAAFLLGRRLPAGDQGNNEESH